MSDNQQKNGRRVLLLLIVIFFAPLAVAWMMFFDVVSWRPAQGIANGELIQPAVPLEPHHAQLIDGSSDEEFLRRKWNLVFIAGDQCAEDCQQILLLMRQVRLSLGKDMGRVGRVMMVPNVAMVSDEMKQAFEGMQIVMRDELSNAIMATTNAEPGEQIFLVDPLGNVMMHFPKDQEPRPMYDDLRHLLKYSRIG